MALPDGLYDLLLTEGLARSLAALDPISADVLALKGGAAEFLAEVITRQLGAILDDVAGDDADKPRRQLELVNDLLVMLRQRLSTGGSSAAAMASADVVDLVASPLRVLRAVKRDQQFPASPEIGLAVPWLFTAGKGSPSLLQEIRREDEISHDIGEPFRDLEALDHALRKIRPLTLWGKPYSVEKYRPMIAPIAYDAVQSMLGTIGHKQRFEYIVVAGGGCHLFKKAIHDALPLYRLDEVREPMYANVRGYQIAGQAKLAPKAGVAPAAEASAEVEVDVET